MANSQNFIMLTTKFLQGLFNNTIAYSSQRELPPLEVKPQLQIDKLEHFNSMHSVALRVKCEV